MSKASKIKLSRINNALLVLIILVNAYVILAPFAPAIIFDWENRGDTKQKQLESEINRKVTPPPKNQPIAQQPNHVIIPSMLLDQPILEGTIAQQYTTLDKGIWRWPDGSTPDKGGNTILIGHRFTYTNPQGVFYYLNKLAINDQIGLWWNNQEYNYRVVKVTEVSPTETAIENNTTQSELTLFTCTPLWNPKDRLVVVANLESRA